MIPFPAKKYNIIYADPPWAFRVWSDKGKGRSAEQHYSTMTLDDLKKLPISGADGIAADDCALFMWVTFPLLQEGLELIKAWGFKYKTCAFCWVKQNPKRGGYMQDSATGYRGTRSSACLPLAAEFWNVSPAPSRP